MTETEVSGVHSGVSGGPVSYTEGLCCPSAFDAGDNTETVQQLTHQLDMLRPVISTALRAVYRLISPRLFSHSTVLNPPTSVWVTGQ